MGKLLQLDTSILGQVAAGEHGDPHAVLGPHPHDGAVTVRVFRPLEGSIGGQPG